MKSLLYLFRRYKAASILNLIGITLAFAGCYLLLTQINFIRTYNHGIKNYENIYRLDAKSVIEKGNWVTDICQPLIERLNRCPQIESYTFTYSEIDIELDKNGSSINEPLTRCNGKTLITFNADKVDGRLYLNKKEEGAIIPASIAKNYFGTEMAAGKQLVTKGGKKINVVGVYKDFPDNSIIENCIYETLKDEDFDYREWNYKTFFRVKENADIKALNSTVKNILYDFVKEHAAAEGKTIDKQDMQVIKEVKFEAIPLTETYMSGHDAITDRGSKTTYIILQLAVVLLIVISIINYTNFSMAQTPMRLRSINTKKVMGESTLSLRLHLIGEGIIVSIIAFVMAMLLVYCISLWEDIDQYILGTISLTDHCGVVFIVAVVSILTGILSTIYSAYYATSFQPAMVLKGGFGLSPRGKSIRQVLVGLQLLVSFVLIVFICVLYSQSYYINNSNYGYAKDALLFGNVSNIPENKKDALTQELMKVNGVENVAFSQFGMGVFDKTMTWGREIDGEQCSVITNRVNWNFLRTCGIDIVEGRDFEKGEDCVCIINEAFRKQHPNIKMNHKVYDNDSMKVVGVCKNVRVLSTRKDNNKAAAFIIDRKEWGDMCYTIYIRIAQNTNKFDVRRNIAKVMKQFCGNYEVPELQFYDESMEITYHEELCFMSQMRMSALLTIIITIIGVFCLTMFETEYRRKEIAIRKVLGSSVNEVLLLFAGRYVLPLITSFVIAAPIAYYASTQWLHNFVEHTPIYWWIFPLSFVIVSVVVLLTVVIQSWKVATMNPANSIKTE